MLFQFLKFHSGVKFYQVSAISIYEHPGETSKNAIIMLWKHLEQDLLRMTLI